MTITVTNIVAGPYTATGAAQNLPFDFKVFTPEEIEVVVGADRTPVDPSLYTVTRNLAVDGQVKEGGSVTLSAGALPAGVAVNLVAKPRLTQDLVFSDVGSRLRNLNEVADRAALRALRSAYEGVLEGAGEEILAMAEAAGSAAGAEAAQLAIDGKLDKATAAEDGTFILGDAARTLSIAEYLRQSVFLIAFKTNSNTWVDAFEAAISYVHSVGGGNIICPALNLVLDRTVVIPYGRITIRGQGVGSTVFYAAFGDADVFRFKDPGGNTYLASRIERASLAVLPQHRPATAGYAIVFDGVGECEAHDVTFIGTYNGVGFLGNNRNCRTRNVGGSDVVNIEFHVSGGGNQHIALGTGFDNTGVANAAFLIEETERVDLDFGTASHHAIGLHIRPSEGKTVQNVFSNFGDYDAPREVGVLIEAVNNNSVVRNIFISGGSAGSASTSNGFIVRKSGTGQVGDIWVSNAMLQASLEDGCLLAAGRVHFNGVHVGNNGIASGAPGIRLMAGLEFFQMVGGASGQLLGGADKSVRPMSWQNQQNHGVVVDSGFSGNAILVGVDLRGNIAGAIQNNSAVTIEVNNCPGYRTRARGVATIPVGAGFVTITPPALAQPITGDTGIVVSCLSNPDLSGVETVWRGGFTATTFDVVTSPFLNVSGQPLQVSWALET